MSKVALGRPVRSAAKPLASLPFGLLSGPSVCGHTGTPCQHECVVDLQTERLQFSCPPPETEQDKPRQVPAISRSVPSSRLPDPAFAGILSLVGKEHSPSLFYFTSCSNTKDRWELSLFCRPGVGPCQCGSKLIRSNKEIQSSSYNLSVVSQANPSDTLSNIDIYRLTSTRFDPWYR